ncbi:MAG: RnfABCDGE type electron transport complex subunit B [SAR324 cluster bacterium]|nr:RnfABCDGE type electron transport complex subunit B [SAR324 cluster bacterium]MBL7034526.1 RnfABCDGE type electron transport complex subunit B [SAR324 cluster bacterium]
MWTEIWVAVGILVGLGLTFATVLALANKQFWVYEDPRIDQVTDLLPGTNCGACGQPGCHAFAEVIVDGSVLPGKCTVSSAEKIEEIAEFLGVDAGKEEKRVARLQCAGGRMEDRDKADYQGQKTCRELAVVHGGNRGCAWGCLGLADCEKVCTFNSIKMNDNELPVVDIETCTACGDCVDVCPKDLFTIMPISQKLIVQCKSLLEGDLAQQICSVACDACGRCVSDSIPGLIEMHENLAVIDYSRNELASPSATWRCPTGAIQWVTEQQFKVASQPLFPLGRVEVLSDKQVRL